MKIIFFSILLSIIFISCNGPEQNSAVGNSEDSVTVNNDTLVDTRGTGTDNTGGMPGPGTITDTFKGKADTADHTSKKDSLKK